MAPQRPTRRCIPAGCLLLKLSDSNIPSPLWSLPDFETWSRFVVLKRPGEPFAPDPCLAKTAPLAPDFQEYLLCSLNKPYVKLLQERWIEMEFGVSRVNAGQGVLRVYLLPDDMDRRDIDRSDLNLRRARLHLLSELDFSHDTWNGHVGPSRSPSPLTCDDDDRGIGEDQSLLQMFNTIPSPEPQPELIENHYAQDAAYDLLGGEVVGLKTDLYPYQRRSAALMLQRESHPTRALDPRLVKALDQHGQPWYYDRVNGFGLLEPRYYEGINGGILAEEMGAGKTLICLALILATKYQTSQIPEIYRESQVVKRPKVVSLADMAAASITKNALPWKPWFGTDGHIDYENCREYIRRHPGHYHVPRPGRPKYTRQIVTPLPARKVYLSYATLVIVPGNLVQQWKQELAKHTVPGSLRTLVISGKQVLPPVEELIETEIILFSSTTFERLQLGEDHPLMGIHFKRCIIDEGHRLGSSTPSFKSNLLLALDRLQLSARWVVTGTPAKGLFGIDQTPAIPGSWGRRVDFSDEQEKDDLKRIGAITTHYLKARPWANTITDYGDKPADWSVYVLQPKHSSRSNGRRDCLRATLDSLIIRHQLSNVAELLPIVEEKVVYLDGSYQDRLSLNLFSMVIIFNAVSSQRTDQDYFFHHRNRKSLLQLVSNLRQASFFGGPFFSPQAITQAVETAVKFLDDGKVPISHEDESLLHDAIAFGRMAAGNGLKQCSNAFGEVPLYVKDFPGGLGEAWSMDQSPGDPVCTNARMIQAMQKYLRPAIDAPNSLRLLFENGKFEQEGRETRLKGLIVETPPNPQEGNSASPTPTPKTQKVAREATREADKPQNRRLSSLGTPSSRTEGIAVADQGAVGDIAEPLARTRIISTASAKMSYLLDQIVRYQKDEKIIIFYENDNVAWYVACALEILQIHHLIYTGTLKVGRRAQYVATFNHNPKYRVMLMDIGHAAFGLDMQSASRIYFINPVLDPQIAAQAVGRARRISQKKPVTVETLVLRGSLEEVIVRRKEEMTQAEQRKCKSILDDRPIYEWILNPKILPLPTGEVDGLAQTTMLQEPQFVFGQGFGRTVEEDEDLVPLPVSPTTPASLRNHEQVRRASSVEAADVLMHLPLQLGSSRKRTFDSPEGPSTPISSTFSPRLPRRVRFAGNDDE
ncbi:hypothetical protein CONLIGDRAFT_567960 [Coniochaeta ligniaria NRRL 30616]|uniref:Helicase C-terminal domain-containing protein n=1 Tax=Coniochaeta ligniaria NRRL 30616 TaxID=1408157 RepID=A0A1J7JZR9_9PEZI|nr:hypothetical protein CONLIGDRAFT_567960 [Coniochaeta ligniaria NRRL 30616]